MSGIDDFLNGGHTEADDLIGTRTMVCAGQTFAVVMPDVQKSYEGALGGLESDQQAIAEAQPGAVINPATLLQKRCTIDGNVFRVAIVNVSTVNIKFTLASAGDSR
jgi:hypothetical protein